jgi:glycosyltransferase involved in cell wall biosynthesis
MTRILLVTDTYEEINGVSTTLKQLDKNGNVFVLHPGKIPHFSCPFYKDVKIISPIGYYKIKRWFNDVSYLMEHDIKGAPFKFESIHVATEGPLGLLAKKWCEKKGYKYNTSFHTSWPDYFHTYWKIPKSLSWKYLRWFHKNSSKIFVSSKAMANNLYLNGFDDTKIEIMERGVDHDLFKQNLCFGYDATKYCIFILYVGRVSKEKNIEDVCELSLTLGQRYWIHVVGDGPYLSTLKKKYPWVNFHGYLQGEDLAKMYQRADVTIFPSTTDTYGLTQIESMACGTPVVAKVAPLSNVVIREDINGLLYSTQEELEQQISKAIKMDRNVVAQSVKDHTWEKVTDTWIENLVLIK